ncbi:putative secreted protein (Por secretion system target) [Neolewinella xylanilytica]|uniref:Putative secreted protein (Por secretion system target) n=1 Tax=Neolewinella xylanilytica TaxID=1514080 RepID=A0A2S6I0G7_9BACT|nr:T9SS type A sorting domain-containing protein [Neolewinella xylanilytica]PPK84340.1 putative secreted protein (Por secretion system target) [Neolewinella xylanilytica]
MNARFTFIFLLVLGFGSAQAQDNVVTINDLSLVGATTYNWTSDNVYMLDGLVYLEEEGVLNIEPGTVIRGMETPTTGDRTSALIITRGASIKAAGTQEAPIIFTAEDDDLEVADDLSYLDDKGLWGGLIILGNAEIATTGGQVGIEGIDADEPRAQYGGGDNPVNDESSGTLTYVSIRHGGSILSNNNEINGLTLGGVGSGTTIDYIEVFANQDDGIEFFGGTVSIKHAAVAFCGDDSFDYDFGWRGTGQYWFSLQANGDDTGRAGEHDGASPDGFAPFSKPNIANATYVGIGEEGTSTGTGDAIANIPFAVIFRDNAGGTYQNSIFYDFNGAAIGIEDLPDTDVDSYGRLLAGDLVLKNNYFYGFGRGEGDAQGTAEAIFLAVGSDEMINTTSSAQVVTNFAENGNVIADPEFNSDDRSEDGEMFDLRPNLFGAAATGAPAPDTTVLDSVGYYGAFAPGNGSDNMAWLAGWTALDQANAYGEVTGVGSVSAATFSLSAPVPNPANASVRMEFEMNRAQDATMTIIDLLGRPIFRRTAFYTAGEQSETFNVSHLANGTYFVIMDVAGSRLVQKLSVKR